jgi:hypothetical protein
MLDRVIWNAEGKSEVVQALDHILAKLIEDIRLQCEFSEMLDTLEGVARTRAFTKAAMEKHGTPATPTTPEELNEALDERRNDTAKQMGHLERRVLDVDALRRAIEEDRATDADLARVQAVLHSSVMKVVIEADWTGMTDPATSITSLGLYAAALQHGFCIVFWEGFPYDELPMASLLDPE